MPPIIEDWKWVVLTLLQEENTLEGMTVVAEVIRDRTKSKFNSDGTIVGTVLAPYQFSGWRTQDPGRIRVAKLDLDSPVVVNAIRAYKNAFELGSNLAKGANLYHADYIQYPEWTKSPNVTRVGQVGRHILYIEKR